MTSPACRKCGGTDGCALFMGLVWLCPSHSAELARWLADPHLSIDVLETAWRAGLDSLEQVSAELGSVRLELEQERQRSRHLRNELDQVRLFESGAEPRKGESS